MASGIAGGIFNFGKKGYWANALNKHGYSNSNSSSGSTKPSPVQYQPYSGERPPSIDYGDQQNLRPVQQQITDTLMRRSQGQDVGYDPRLITEANQNFDSVQAQQADRQNQDINNELSGTGQSRNLAARAQTLGRFGQDQQRQKTQFMSGIDIANMEKANQEKQAATQGLQNLNTFDFGQENAGANFDLNAYNAENAAKVGAYSTASDSYNLGDPNSTMISSLGKIGGAVAGYYVGGPTGAVVGSDIGGQVTGSSSGQNNSNQNNYSNYLTSLSNQKKQNTTANGQNLTA